MEWFYRMAEVSHAIIAVVRGEEITYANPACGKLLACDRNELIGKSPVVFAHPRFRDAVAGRIRARYAGEEVNSAFDVEVLDSDGETHWLRYTSTFIEVDGEPAIVLTGIDDTERRDSEERLRLLVSGTAAVTGQDFFDSLTRHMVQALGVGYAFVAECTDLTSGSLRSLSFWDRDQHGSAFECRLPDGPLPSASEDEDIVFLPENVTSHIPESVLLRERSADAYLGCPLRDSGGSLIGFLAVFHDGPFARGMIGESVIKIFAARAAAEIEALRAERALATEKEHAVVTLASIADGVLRTDSRGIIDWVNPAAERIVGWSQEEALGHSIDDVYAPVDEASGKALPSSIHPCLRGERSPEGPVVKRVQRRGDGEQFLVQETVAPLLRHGEIRGAVVVVKDVSELKKMEREVQYLASHDRLTGLLNRSELELTLDRALREVRESGERYVLCQVDLDGFKLINDTCGHHAGDELLRQVTELLQARTRSVDLVARLGGDEFAILFGRCSPGQAKTFVRALRQGLSQLRFRWEDRLFEISAAFGLVPLSSTITSVTQLLADVDGACIVAKERGRNRIHEARAGDQAVAEHHGQMQWVHRIHQAFADERFVLYAQPILPLQPNHEPMHEIFLRLVEPDGEIVPPGDLIQAAERYRMITDIDRWVVHAALKAISAMEDPGNDGLKPIFTINLSGQSLGEERFLEDIVSQLRASGVSPRQLCFEITETAAIANLGRATLFFSVLRDIGVRFVLDDFGSGLSSFAYLRSLPVDFLKIDGELVRDAGADPIQQALVESIHNVGRVLGIRTIGECVETESTLDVLRRVGLDYAQGFWLGRPKAITTVSDALSDLGRKPTG